MIHTGYESYVVTNTLMKRDIEEAISDKYLNAKLLVWSVIGAICIITPVLFTVFH